MIRLADEELIQLGLVTAGHVIDGTVIRQAKAYPVYDENYEERIDLFRIWLEKAQPACTSSGATACTSTITRIMP